MDPSRAIPDLTQFFIQETGLLLFCLVFLFLYRQSRVLYFGLWAAAWVLRFGAAIFGQMLLRTEHAAWLAPYAILEFAFVMVLIAAARAGFGSDARDWRVVLRLIPILPVFIVAIYAFAMQSRFDAYYVSHALSLAFVYLYNFFVLKRHLGLGGRVFRFSLLVLAIVFLGHAAVFLYLSQSGAAPQWAKYLRTETYYDFVLHSLLAFAAMAMWSESQIDRIRDLTGELDHLRRVTRQEMQLDRLTGLLNQAALARRVEDAQPYDGVVAVCDMDNFKEINDRYGHLVGDEILRNIGNLLQASIRHEDEAYRWGGDEFVILFQDQHVEVARKRMAEIEARLADFRVRGFGVLPIRFSWGTAGSHDRPLREALDEADRDMYAQKRSKAPERRRVR